MEPGLAVDRRDREGPGERGLRLRAPAHVGVGHPQVRPSATVQRFVAHHGLERPDRAVVLAREGEMDAEVEPLAQGTTPCGTRSGRTGKT